MPKSQPRLFSLRIMVLFERHLKSRQNARLMRNGEDVSKKFEMRLWVIDNFGNYNSLRLMTYSSEKRELPDSKSSIIMIEIFLTFFEFVFLSSRLIACKSYSDCLVSEVYEVRSCLLLIRLILSVSKLSVLLIGSISFKISTLLILMASAIEILLNLLMPKLFPLDSIPGTTIFSFKESEDPELF